MIFHRNDTLLEGFLIPLRAEGTLCGRVVFNQGGSFLSIPLNIFCVAITQLRRILARVARRGAACIAEARRDAGGEARTCGCN